MLLLYEIQRRGGVAELNDVRVHAKFWLSNKNVQKPQTPRQSHRRHPHSQTELVISSCMPFHIRVPVPGRTA